MITILPNNTNCFQIMYALLVFFFFYRIDILLQSIFLPPFFMPSLTCTIYFGFTSIALNVNCLFKTVPYLMGAIRKRSLSNTYTSQRQIPGEKKIRYTFKK